MIALIFYVINNFLLFLAQPKNILNQCRTLLTIALEIRKKEIIEMEKELKLVKELSDNTKAKLKEVRKGI